MKRTLLTVPGVVNQKALYLFVIPGLTRNPVFLNWIPAFARMTVPESM